MQNLRIAVSVDNTALHAVSCTLRNNRSYKQMFWDALTAKKSLAKGYEQLAIWFGDAERGSNKESMQSLFYLQLPQLWGVKICKQKLR
ncbi:hypothetical protein SLE2022_318760 [Rubroshorea leprosula]